MKRYYVCMHAQDHGEHEVHTAVCRWMPKTESRIYLGIFSHCSAAVANARVHYAHVTGCPHCSPDAATPPTEFPLPHPSPGLTEAEGLAQLLWTLQGRVTVLREIMNVLLDASPQKDAALTTLTHLRTLAEDHLASKEHHPAATEADTYFTLGELQMITELTDVATRE